MSAKKFFKIAFCQHQYYCDYHFYGKRLEKHYKCDKCGDIKVMRSNDPIRNVYVNREEVKLKL